MTSRDISVATLPPIAAFVFRGSPGAEGSGGGGRMVVGSGEEGVVEITVALGVEGVKGVVVVTVWVKLSVTVVMAPSYTQDVTGTLAVSTKVTVSTEGISVVRVAIEIPTSTSVRVVVAGTPWCRLRAGLGVVRITCSLPMAKAGYRLSAGWSVMVTVTWRVDVAISFLVVMTVVTKLVKVLRTVKVLVRTELNVVVDVVPVWTVDVAVTVPAVFRSVSDKAGLCCWVSGGRARDDAATEIDMDSSG
jgi:hypothetical protein